MTIRARHLIGATAATAAAIALGPLTPTHAATPQPQVLRFYMHAVNHGFVTAHGKPFTPSVARPPRPGDQLRRTDLEYTGTAASHAAQWTASDEQTCVVKARGAFACTGRLAVGGSMIFTRAVQTSPSKTVRERVVGGTGVYAGATGRLVLVSPTTATTSGDLTITVRRP